MMDQNNSSNNALSPKELEEYLSAYDQIKLIAIGGMGAVYKARQISLDRPVAIKILTHTYSFSLQFRQSFKQEAKVMAKLNHPSIASIYDYGEINGMLYIVMQFIEGRSLFQISNGKQVAHKEAASLICKIAKALSKAHAVGILHRDIKPANIIVNEKATPVLIDFGLAHRSDDTTLKGESVFGTDGYTAPEVINPPYQADQRSDIFALGVLFYELLTGAPPQQPYLDPSEIAKVDQRYDKIIKQMMSPDQNDRPSTAQSFTQVMGEIMNTKLSLSEPAHDDNHANFIPQDYEQKAKSPITQSKTSVKQRPSQGKKNTPLIILTIIGIGISLATIIIAHQKSAEKEAQKTILNESSLTK